MHASSTWLCTALELLIQDIATDIDSEAMLVIHKLASNCGTNSPLVNATRMCRDIVCMHRAQPTLGGVTTVGTHVRERKVREGPAVRAVSCCGHTQNGLQAQACPEGACSASAASAAGAAPAAEAAGRVALRNQATLCNRVKNDDTVHVQTWASWLGSQLTFHSAGAPHPANNMHRTTVLKTSVPPKS